MNQNYFLPLILYVFLLQPNTVEAYAKYTKSEYRIELQQKKADNVKVSQMGGGLDIALLTNYLDVITQFMIRRLSIMRGLELERQHRSKMLCLIRAAIFYGCRGPIVQDVPAILSSLMETSPPRF